MIKINDKNIYAKEVRTMFDDYEKTVKKHNNLDSEMKSCIDTCESVVEVIDNLITAARTCPVSLVKARIYLILSLIGGMLSSSLEEYTTERINDIDVIDVLKKFLDMIEED